MSQPPYPPPPPPGYPPPNYPPPGYPPPGYPPGGYPPGAYGMPPSTRTSGAAVASLICGLLLCVPFLTSLLALILGLAGISSTKHPQVRGRGLAIAGLILGALGLLMWAGATREVMYYARVAGPERTFAKGYVTALAANNLDYDSSVSTDHVTKEMLEASQQQAQGWGAIQSSTIFAIPVTDKNGNYVCVAIGVCQFAGQQHQFKMRLVKDANGNFLADSFQWTQ